MLTILTFCGNNQHNRFEQRLDHFNWEDTRTFRQRYFVNDQYFKPGSDGPVFLCVGGEGPPLDGMVVVNSVYVPVLSFCHNTHTEYRFWGSFILLFT